MSGRMLFLGAIGVIALHVIDDSFLQPQPGTSAGDHLISGLVPLAALGLATASYLRVRAGGRAASALVVGFWAPTPHGRRSRTSTWARMWRRSSCTQATA